MSAEGYVYALSERREWLDMFQRTNQIDRAIFVPIHANRLDCVRGRHYPPGTTVYVVGPVRCQQLWEILHLEAAVRNLQLVHVDALDTVPELLALSGPEAQGVRPQPSFQAALKALEALSRGRGRG